MHVDVTPPTGALWNVVAGGDVIAAAAIHDGHQIRAEVNSLMVLTETERLREEDPFTAGWTNIVDNQIVGLRSRFEVDLNRPPESCVYLSPEQAWGLTVYRSQPPPGVMARTMATYNAFYDAMKIFFDDLRLRHGSFVVLDLHSYNHRRAGPHHPPADPRANPDVNVGTGTMTDPERWRPLVARFIAELRSFDFAGRHLDVRENVRFRGGHFPSWIHATFAGAACCLSIEVKKFFMDEWTGHADANQLALLREALASTLPGLRESLSRHAATPV